MLGGFSWASFLGKVGIVLASLQALRFKLKGRVPDADLKMLVNTVLELFEDFYRMPRGKTLILEHNVGC